jgi:hypothetical protein
VVERKSSIWVINSMSATDGDETFVFQELKFGTWEKKADVSNETEPFKHLSAQSTRKEVIDAIHRFLWPDCNEIQLMLGVDKLRYEVSLIQEHRRNNHGRIDIDFSSITGIAFDDQHNKVTLQVSAPPLTWLGRKETPEDDGTKPDTFYDRHQEDFGVPLKYRADWALESGDDEDDEDGAGLSWLNPVGIKNWRTHCFRTDAESYENIKAVIEKHLLLRESLAAGIDEQLMSAQFSNEQVKRSYDDAVHREAAKARRKREHQLKRASIKLEKSNAQLCAGLLPEIPGALGKWAAKCIDRWRLVAPFDPSVTETQWKAYYQERAALDWWTEANGCVFHSSEYTTDDRRSTEDYDDHGKHFSLPPWTEDFPNPIHAIENAFPGSWASFGDRSNDLKLHTKSLRKAVEEVARGCRHLEGDIEQGVYVLSGWSEWDCETLEKFDLVTRVYSPSGLGTSLDLSSRYDSRSGYSWAV